MMVHRTYIDSDEDLIHAERDGFVGASRYESTMIPEKNEMGGIFTNRRVGRDEYKFGVKESDCIERIFYKEILPPEQCPHHFTIPIKPDKNGCISQCDHCGKRW